MATKAIKNRQYEVIPFGALQGRKVFARLLQTVGPALGAVGGSAEAALGMLVSRLDEPTLEYLCEQFAPQTSVSHESKMVPLQAIFDRHFACNYGEMILWLVFGLEVNFASFFVDLLGSATPAEPKAP